MKGTNLFSNSEIIIIKKLLRCKISVSSAEQKRYRDDLRKMKFYISDFSRSNKGFDVDDLERLIQSGEIIVTDDH